MSLVKIIYLYYNLIPKSFLRYFINIHNVIFTYKKKLYYKLISWVNTKDGY